MYTPIVSFFKINLSDQLSQDPPDRFSPNFHQQFGYAAPLLDLAGISTEFPGAITTRFCFTYRLEGVTTTPSGLHARLCHAFLVVKFYFTRVDGLTLPSMSERATRALRRATFFRRHTKLASRDGPIKVVSLVAPYDGN